MHRLRVANIVEEGRWGGPQARIVKVGAELHNLGVETTVILPAEGSERFRAELEAAGVGYRLVSLSRASRNWRDAFKYALHFVSEVWALHRELESRPYDLVHVSGGSWQIRAACAGWLARLPVLWHLNDTDVPAPVATLFHLLARCFASGFIVTADRVFDYYLRDTALAKNPVFSIQAPVDTGKFDPSKVKPDSGILSFPGMRVVAIANINPNKGLDMLIDTAARLQGEGQRYSFIVVGPVFATQANYFARLKRKVQDKGLTATFHFVGQRENIEGVLKATDVFVCSSIAEAGPMTVWEAMAMECPVISTDVGDVSVYIRSGHSGTIVPVGDSQAMANALSELAERPTLRREFGHQARVTACAFLDIRRIGAKTESAYRTIVSAGRKSSPVPRSWILGIDASNIRGAGGLTHLTEMLKTANPESSGFAKVIVWSSNNTLNAIQPRPWLEKRSSAWLDRGPLERLIWQRFQFTRELRSSACDVLFVPGGAYIGRFRPVVTMSQNLLPFEMPELRRYNWSKVGMRLHSLRLIQARTFGRAQKTIFLTHYARKVVTQQVKLTHDRTAIVPHGIGQSFFSAPRMQRPLGDYSAEHPMRILYVSIVDMYKHQWQVAEAVASLRASGLPLVLDLVGPAYAPAMARLNATLDRVDPQHEVVRYLGAIPYSELHRQYAVSDLCVFASSCENLPIILLEGMASGLPIACSERGPMPEVLGPAGTYFNPEDPVDIARAIRLLAESPELRTKSAHAGYERASAFSWERCAREIFSVLADTARERNPRHQTGMAA